MRSAEKGKEDTESRPISLSDYIDPGGLGADQSTRLRRTEAFIAWGEAQVGILGGLAHMVERSLSM